MAPRAPPPGSLLPLPPPPPPPWRRRMHPSCSCPHRSPRLSRALLRPLPNSAAACQARSRDARRQK
eukprot:364033-Chlamydomonas_euryale.AAC.4